MLRRVCDHGRSARDGMTMVPTSVNVTELHVCKGPHHRHSSRKSGIRPAARTPRTSGALSPVGGRLTRTLGGWLGKAAAGKGHRESPPFVRVATAGTDRAAPPGRDYCPTVHAGQLRAP